MAKPIKRFTIGYLVNRLAEGKQPVARLFTDDAVLHTSRVIEAKFNDDGTLCRLETLNTIYVQVQ